MYISRLFDDMQGGAGGVPQGLETDSKSAEGNLVGVRPPPGTKIIKDLS